MNITLKIFIIATLFAITSCRKTESFLKYTNGRQHLKLNELTIEGQPLAVPKVYISVPDTISISEKLNAQIFLGKGDYKLLAAYYNCNIVENPTVDTARIPKDYTKRIDGCKLELLIENDTVKIEWKSPTTGSKTFKDITLLTLHGDGVYRTQTVNFNYFVMD